MDWKKVYKLIDEGYISRQKHPEVDLWIYNYTPKAQYDKIWTPETMQCRGLITDRDRNIVARPFPKFFNLEEHEGLSVNDITEPYEVYDKLDGSLGILYWVNDKPYIATRGSFASDQARIGTQLLYSNKQLLEYLMQPGQKGFTYLFEVVYPENRIVVDYGDTEDLILLDVIHTITGERMGIPYDYAWSVAPKVHIDIGDMQGQKRENKEGYVIVFESGLRVKVKHDEYVRLHRIVTQTTARSIWEMLKEGQSLEEVLERVPDEFYEWVKEKKFEIESRFTEIKDEARELFEKASKKKTRKEQAVYIQENAQTPFIKKVALTGLRDGQVSEELIWKGVRPAHEKPFQ